ncbi:hypothetical protein ACFL1H_04225 [Nanoarchaeota archaeon]
MLEEMLDYTKDEREIINKLTIKAGYIHLHENNLFRAANCFNYSKSISQYDSKDKTKSIIGLYCTLHKAIENGNRLASEYVAVKLGINLTFNMIQKINKNLIKCNFNQEDIDFCLKIINKINSINPDILNTTTKLIYN